MNRTFIEMPSFRNDWMDLELTEDDLIRLQQQILAYPAVGKRIKGTGGVRKMRFAFEQRGKSGSTRVIYIDLEIKGKIYLLAAYAKADKENLSKAERNELKKLVSILKKEGSK